MSLLLNPIDVLQVKQSLFLVAQVVLEKYWPKTFLEEGATVIVSGRKEENLKELNAAYPEIHTIKWDIGRYLILPLIILQS